jgi:hypothetical protein
MGAAGFKRRDAQYFHLESDFFIEFPRGPLAIGQDLDIVPARLEVGRTRVTALSATDSCRDRLALRHRIDLKLVRAWSEGESSLDEFAVFEAELRRAKLRKRASAAKRSSSKAPRAKR